MKKGLLEKSFKLNLGNFIYEKFLNDFDAETKKNTSNSGIE